MPSVGRGFSPGILHLILLIATAAAVSLPVASQSQSPSRFVDDAGREVQLPPRVQRVFAAGGPAEVLLHTLAPEMLVGRNRLPEGEARAFFPPGIDDAVLIRRLPELDDPSADAELLALKPHVYVDYGTVDADYVAVLDAVQKRTGVPGLILDGALHRIPGTYRRLATALGVGERGEKLAAAAERLLTTYRASLPPGRRVWLACSADGYLPCLEDERSGEVLRWIGGINVAGRRATAPNRPLTIAEIKALAPSAIVVNGGAAAIARVRNDPAWRTVDAVAAGRVHAWPELPYNWGARPPSVNRLPGLVWLAYVLTERPFDAQFARDIRRFFRDFYHVELTEAQVRTLAESSAAPMLR